MSRRHLLFGTYSTNLEFVHFLKKIQPLIAIGFLLKIYPRKSRSALSCAASANDRVLRALR